MQLFFFLKNLYLQQGMKISQEVRSIGCVQLLRVFFVFWCFFLNWTPKKNYNENKQNR